MSGSLKTLDSIFIRQIHEWDCGPVAALNAIAWALCDKIQYKREARKLMKEWLKTDRDGTYDNHMTRALKTIGKAYNFKVKYKIGLDWVDTRKRLLRGDHLVLAHIDYTQEWHFSSWYVNENGKLVGINAKYKKPPSYFSMLQLKKYALTADKEGVKPAGYFLRRT